MNPKIGIVEPFATKSPVTGTMPPPRGIGGFLHVSKELQVLWSAPYLSRLGHALGQCVGQFLGQVFRV